MRTLVRLLFHRLVPLPQGRGSNRSTRSFVRVNSRDWSQLALPQLVLGATKENVTQIRAGDRTPRATLRASHSDGRAPTRWKGARANGLGGQTSSRAGAPTLRSSNAHVKNGTSYVRHDRLNRSTYAIARCCSPSASPVGVSNEAETHASPPRRVEGETRSRCQSQRVRIGTPNSSLMVSIPGRNRNSARA